MPQRPHRKPPAAAPASLVATLVAACLLGSAAASAQTAPPAAPVAPAAPAPVPASKYDAELARQVGANENGMRGYVLVILKTGPNKVPVGPARDEMFKGHFANIQRLADQGKLVQAGPLDGVDGWRGLYVFATTSIDEAKTHVALDPVIVQGEMVAEYHKFFSTAALVLLNDMHAKVTKKNF